MPDRHDSFFSDKAIASTAPYLVFLILIAAFGDIMSELLPALAYIVVGILPIYKIKPRNIFFKYGFIALALLAWAITSVLVEGTSFDIMT